MISVLKSLASLLFYTMWVLILLDALALVLIGCIFVTKTALEDLLGCTLTRFTKKEK